jgi:hypothetical protein
MDGKTVKGALRGLFEAQVMNHGDYSLVYGRSSGTGSALLLGYRRTPLELVLCPVDLGRLSRTGGVGHHGTVPPAAPVCGIDLTNVATVADTGTGYQVRSVTGFRAGFEVDAAPRLSIGTAGADSGQGTVALEQGQDAEDFHQFMGHFMDTLDGFYEVPDVADILQGAYALTS